MKPALFVDTNIIDSSKSFDRLFGSRVELERIARQYQLCIPRVVYDELIRHKEREFDRQKSELIKSGVLKIANVDVATLRSLSFDSVKQSINESIPYTVCEMEEPITFFEEYYPLAINNGAPFSKGSDKGFKDACLASSIRRFIAEHEEIGTVVLITDDSRLTEFFETDERVVVYSRLSEALNWKNESGCLTNEADSRKPGKRVETITETAQMTDMEKAISEFCGSRSFASTHRAIEELLPYRSELRVQDKVKILKAAADNDQISWILTDEDVAAFLMPLFDELSDHLNNHQYFSYVDAAGLPNNRLDENGNVQFSLSERQSFKAFTDALIGHIHSRDWNSVVTTDTDTIRVALVNLLARATLDETLLSWQSIAEVFISGGVTADEGFAHRKIVSDFVDLLQSSTNRKQDSIIQGLASRLQVLDFDVPF